MTGCRELRTSEGKSWKLGGSPSSPNAAEPPGRKQGRSPLQAYDTNLPKKAGSEAAYPIAPASRNAENCGEFLVDATSFPRAVLPATVHVEVKS